MRKLKIGQKVNTVEGKGEVVGYDLEWFDAMRHIIKLDSGKLWAGKNPCFFDNEIEVIEETK